MKCAHERALHWTCLGISIAFEVGATMCLKMSVVETHPWFWIAMSSYLCAFGIFTKALECVPLDVAYAIWSAVGTLVMFAINYIFFDRVVVTWIKLASLCAISAGCVGMLY